MEKKEYLDYLRLKFKTIEESSTQVVARLASYRSKHCLALYQICKGDKNRRATLLTYTDNGKITKANMCMIPTFSQIELLDEFPS